MARDVRDSDTDSVRATADDGAVAGRAGVVEAVREAFDAAAMSADERRARMTESLHRCNALRERLLERADYQCEYRGPGGVRCTARTRLEVGHIDPIG